MTNETEGRRAQDGAERSGAPEGLTLIAATVVAAIFWRELWGGVTWWWRAIVDFSDSESIPPYGGLVIFAIGITLAVIVALFALALIAKLLHFAADLFSVGRRGWRAGAGGDSGDA